MTLNAKIGVLTDFFSRYEAAQVFIIHKEAPPSPTPHAPMADVYWGPDGPSPSDMQFSKL